MIQPDGVGVYHCVSRVVDKQFLFGERERDVFLKVMRQVEAFSGVRVITWTILSNHFHVLLDVPRRPEVEPTDDEILGRCRELYSVYAMKDILWQYEDAVRLGEETHTRWRQRYLKRMWDLSEFMKTLKQKFTSWYNRAWEREGGLWERRFTSVVVEGSWGCILKVAAYIDLNAVRAGLVDDPMDYRWCGYAQAVAGDRCARRGLVQAMQLEKANADWRHVGAAYRKTIFGIGEENSTRSGLSRKAVAEVWAAGGRLTLAQLLRCRIRHFTRGVAVGSAEFLERYLHSHRAAFGANRSSGARAITRAPAAGLKTMRTFRGGVSPPT